MEQKNDGNTSNTGNSNSESGQNVIDQRWLETCVQAGEFLYGVYPVEQLKKMYETRKGCSATIDDLIGGVKASDSLLMEYREGSIDAFRGVKGCADSVGFLAPTELEHDKDSDAYKKMRAAQKSGNPYAALHLDPAERMGLLNEQGSVEFYTPTEEEIRQLVDYGHIGTNEEDALAFKMMDYGVNDTEFLTNLWQQTSTGAMDYNGVMQSVINRLFNNGPGGAHDINELNSILQYVVPFINNVNLRLRRGWKPAELAKTMPRHQGMPKVVPASAQAAKMMRESQGELKAMGVNVDFDATLGKFVKIGPYGEKKVVKVYPNDPCPCGSGKKYKNCHGRLAMKKVYNPGEM